MARLHIQRRVKYQEELDLDFPDQVAAMPGAADLNRCIQCGTGVGAFEAGHSNIADGVWRCMNCDTYDAMGAEPYRVGEPASGRGADRAAAPAEPQAAPTEPLAVQPEPVRQAAPATCTATFTLPRVLGRRILLFPLSYDLWPNAMNLFIDFQVVAVLRRGQSHTAQLTPGTHEIHGIRHGFVWKPERAQRFMDRAKQKREQGGRRRKPFGVITLAPGEVAEYELKMRGLRRIS